MSNAKPMGDQRRVDSYAYAGDPRWDDEAGEPLAPTQTRHVTPKQQQRRRHKLLHGLARSGQVQVQARPSEPSPGRAEADTAPVDQSPRRVWSAQAITDGLIDKQLRTEATARFLERKGLIGRRARKARRG
jgi:hypothetical protein